LPPQPPPARSLWRAGGKFKVQTAVISLKLQTLSLERGVKTMIEELQREFDGLKEKVHDLRSFL
jgi:hypothetical protein